MKLLVQHIISLPFPINLQKRMPAVEHGSGEVPVEGVDVPLDKVARVVSDAAREVLHPEAVLGRSRNRVRRRRRCCGRGGRVGRGGGGRRGDGGRRVAVAQDVEMRVLHGRHYISKSENVPKVARNLRGCC